MSASARRDRRCRRSVVSEAFTVVSVPSGCGRRVSLKRRSSDASLASRKITRVGIIRKTSPQRKQGSHYGAYGSKRNRVTAETAAKSRFAEPVYYVFDNRGRAGR